MASTAASIGIAIGIAAAVALTAGFAAPVIVAGAATTTIAGAAFATGVALQAGVLAFGAGMAITMSPEAPEPISQVARQTTTTSDPEAPWEWVYGTVVKGSALAWTGVGGDEDQFTGFDFVVACHPCESIIEVQIGDWCFPITTNSAGSDLYNGRGLILNTGQAFSSFFPATWYTSVPSSLWTRSPQDDKNSDNTPHIGIRINLGNRTATEPFMASLFGTKYSSVARKFIGHSVVSVVTRVHSELGTGSPQEILFRLQGKNDLQDHTGGNAAFRNNAAHVFADYCREHLGIPVTEIVNLQTAATECNDTTWSGAGGEPRYTFDGVIRDDIEPVEALREICKHMAGGYSERGDNIVLWTGTAKTAWADGPLTENDVAGPVAVVPPDEDARFNTLLPHFVVQRPLNEDGEFILHGKMEPGRGVSSASYVAEDNDVVLRQDIKFAAGILSRRVRFLAWVALNQSRLGASLQLRCKKRAMVLEVGDVVACNLPELFPSGTKFQVVSKAVDLLSFSVDLGLIRYEDAIYTPGAVPDDDAIGVVPRSRSTLMPLVTGLTADVLEDSAQINANGVVTVDVVVSWNLVSNILVRNTGDIRVAWKRQTASAYKVVTASGDDIQTVIPGLRQGVAYHIRARAEGGPTAGRPDKPVGAWTTNISFTPDSGLLDLSGPPSTGVQGANQVVDGAFERGPGASIWDIVDETATATGSAQIETTGGKFGPHRAKITITAASAGNEYRVRNNIYMPISAGEWRRVVVAVAKTASNPDFEARVNIIFYDSDQVSQFTTVPIIATVSATPWPEERLVGGFQVPGDLDIAFCRAQLHHEALSGGAQESVWDGLEVNLHTRMSNEMESAQVNRTNNTWVALSTLEDFAGGGADQDDIYFDGQTSISVSGYVSANVKRGTSNITVQTRATARLVLEEVGVGSTVITGETLVARMTVADGTELGSNGETDVEAKTLEAVVTPTQGHFLIHIEGRHLGDTTNGTAQFRDRRIIINKV